MELTKQQKEQLPRWLWRFPCSDEHGNYQLTRKEYEAEVRRILQLPEPAAPTKYASSISQSLLEDTRALFLRWLNEPPSKELRDATTAHGLVVEQALTALRQTNDLKRNALDKARAARGELAGRPPIALMVRNPNGDGTVVHGYEAAAKLIGRSTANSLAVSMSNALRLTGRPLITVGRPNRAEEMWTVEKLGTNDAVVHEPCQKDETEAQRENESS